MQTGMTDMLKAQYEIWRRPIKILIVSLAHIFTLLILNTIVFKIEIVYRIIKK